jgi:hypothetical protein
MSEAKSRCDYHPFIKKGRFFLVGNQQIETMTAMKLGNRNDLDTSQIFNVQSFTK